MKELFYNCDCIAGAQKHLPAESVDLVICDPPYGIGGGGLHKHYNRNEEHVVAGYREVAAGDYARFSERWIAQAERVLKPGGTLYVVSGYTHLPDILDALRKTKLKEQNHIIWKYNFGVYTKIKFISSHYHILYYIKGGRRHTFNSFARYADAEKNDNGGSLNYQDREDVWIINREYKPGARKNKNELPRQLLIKLIQYSSNEGDLVCDMFLGSFSTAKVAIGLQRRATGFEINKKAYDLQMQEIKKIAPGSLLDGLRKPPRNRYYKQGQRLSETEIQAIQKQYRKLKKKGTLKKEVIEAISKDFGRGYWSVLRIVDGSTNKSIHAQDDVQKQLL